MKFRISTLIVGLIVAVLTSCTEDEKYSSDLYSAVPSQSVLLLEIENLPKAINEINSSRLYAEVDSFASMVDLNQRLSTLYNCFSADSLTSYFNKNSIVVALTISGADKYDLLFIGNRNEELEHSIGKKLSKVFKSKKQKYADAEIFHFSNETSSYYLSAYQNLLLFSTNKKLVEEGIRQTKSEFGIKDDVGFSKLQKTSNKKDLANLYVNLERAPEWLKTVFPNANSQYIEKLGSWTELDISVHNQELIMSGLTLIPTDKAYYLEAFKGVSAQEPKAEAIVPSASGFWVAHTFDNANQYYRNYRAYLEKAGKLRKHDQLLEKLTIDTEKTLLNWVDTEMGLFGSAGKDEQQNLVAYFNFRSEKDVTTALDSISKKDFIEGYRGLIIKKLIAENALPRMYGSLFEEFYYPYYFIHNDFVLFSENLAMLKGVINDVLDSKTLGMDEEFLEFKAELPAKSHVKVVAINSGFNPMMANLIKKDAKKEIEKFEENLNRYRWAALQMKVDGDAAFTNFYLKHQSVAKEKVSRLWSTQLKSQASNEPQFLKNHRNRKYDITIQDDNHILYLLDYSGKILWEKQLDGPIMGQITQVDLYKNKKLQMVFNTPKSLYVLDRLSRDVENFPISFENTLTAPVGVFDYDQNRTYRFVVAEGKELKNFDLTGKPVKGWKFKKTKGTIISQPQHFAVAGKDVIIINDDEGHLYQLTRAGKERFKPISDLPELKSPFYIKTGESLATSEILSVSPQGELFVLNPGSGVDHLFLDESRPADHFLYFDDSYIFTHENELTVKSSGKPWTAALDGDISVKPKVMIFKGDFYAAAFSKNKEEIRLFNSKGELVDGFPVFAQGPFDMGSLKQDGVINIVSYSEDGTLICYRIN